MKTSFFLFILFLIGSSAATAQTEKGRWQTGVSLANFTYSNQNGYRSFSGNLSPSGGYFIINNLVVGTGVPLSLTTNKYLNQNGINSSNMSIGLSPYIRHYFGSTRLKPYVGLSYSYSTNRVRIKNNSQNISADGFTSSLSPTVGVAYFINPTIALNIGLNYIWQRYKNGYPVYDATGKPIDIPTSTSKYASLNIGFQIFLGK